MQISECSDSTTTGEMQKINKSEKESSRNAKLTGSSRILCDEDNALSELRKTPQRQQPQEHSEWFH